MFSHTNIPTRGELCIKTCLGAIIFVVVGLSDAIGGPKYQFVELGSSQALVEMTFRGYAEPFEVFEVSRVHFTQLAFSRMPYLEALVASPSVYRLPDGDLVPLIGLGRGMYREGNGLKGAPGYNGQTGIAFTGHGQLDLNVNVGNDYFGYYNSSPYQREYIYGNWQEVPSNCSLHGLTTDHLAGTPYSQAQLRPQMQAAVFRFQESLREKVSTTFTPTSGYRTEIYQDHFFDIAEAYRRLVDLPGIDWQLVDRRPQLFASEPSGFDCINEIDDVNWEIRAHLLKVNSKGYLAVNQESDHSKGLAVDFNIADIRRYYTDAQILAKAEASGLEWFKGSDDVHFEYAGSVNNKSFDSGGLDGWNTQGSGSATVEESNGSPGTYHVKMTTGSPIEISQSFDAPDAPAFLRFQSQFLSSGVQLDVRVGDLIVASLESSGPESIMQTRWVVLPSSLPFGELTNMSFRLDGVTGGSLLLDNIDVRQFGDYNGDDVIDELDYLQWSSQYGNLVSPGDGADGNFNAHIDAADYTIWRDRGVGGQSGAILPEPNQILVLLLISVCLRGCQAIRSRIRLHRVPIGS